MIIEKVLTGFLNGIPKFEGNFRHVETVLIDFDTETKWVKYSHLYAENLGTVEIYWKLITEAFPTHTVPAIGDKIELKKVTKKITITYD